jgi:hypothetical protein
MTAGRGNCLRWEWLAAPSVTLTIGATAVVARAYRGHDRAWPSNLGHDLKYHLH